MLKTISFIVSWIFDKENTLKSTKKIIKKENSYNIYEVINIDYSDNNSLLLTSMSREENKNDIEISNNHLIEKEGLVKEFIRSKGISPAYIFKVKRTGPNTYFASSSDKKYQWEGTYKVFNNGRKLELYFYNSKGKTIYGRVFTKISSVIDSKMIKHYSNFLFKNN